MSAWDRSQRAHYAQKTLAESRVLELVCRQFAANYATGDARKALLEQADELVRFQEQIRVWIEIWRLQ